MLYQMPSLIIMRFKLIYGIAEGVDIKRDIVRIIGLFINLNSHSQKQSPHCNDEYSAKTISLCD
ncbi:hypothetical protein GCM10009410_24710 [Shewanella ulleungensis]|uniref:Uncharacterized protein n=1 Tax=Shewanella ulleungensis TaxID=2282699 RepID=A0ABQ2QR64_9GAMM|nr:hypothetical protein GCM10009410_24710 [Shewanella ulleungensis]